MAVGVFFKGLVIGLSIAAPVGPIGVLCIRRTLAEGRAVGLATGLGAATADAAYGAVAGFGLTAISGFLLGHKLWLNLIGGGFLCFLGFRTFCSRPPDRASAPASGGCGTAFLSTFFLTLTNPMTILSFLGIFVGFGLGTSQNYLAAGVLVAGVFLGSALWWLFLSAGVSLLRSRIDRGWMQAVNRLSGAIIFAFGIYSLLNARVSG